MEAIGAGLPIIGFDVRYGNRNFIENGRNGYLIGVDDDTDQKDKIRMLAEAAVKLFTEADMDEFHHNSYEKAREYLTEEVGLKWKRLIAQMM
jgi:glycosyltransferase involved in cell wall biosynthesis